MSTVLTPEIKETIEVAVKEAVEKAVAPLKEVTERRVLRVFSYEDEQPIKPEKGIRLARAVRALAAAKGDPRQAAYIAENVYKDSVVAKALSEGTGSSGGYLVPPEFSREIIELLYAQAVVRKAGARVLPMTSNVLNVPKLASGAQANYIGENTNIPATQPSFAQLTLTAKKLAALVPISNDLIRDSNPKADAVVRDDLVNAMALREDLAFLRDDGTNNKPKGILYWTDAANKFNAGTDPIADLGKAVRLVRASNSRMVRCAWVFSPRTEYYLMTLRDSAGKFVFRDEMIQGKVLGYPYFVTTQIPENLGVNGNETEIYFGDFMDAVIGENEELLIDVSTEAAYFDGTNLVSAFSTDQTVIRAIARHDFALRHEKSFAVIQAVTWGA
ncbi:phage major capsid protein, HK97 family [Thermanaeromonas toyohensis ToBE]|uniref:Phage major capsid protein, HK97 family n=1 Tax=Thermanaeromonas toyohensis ToBE TaxID=698762 RepID=A0A1W1VX51_9FIRM|nr:phage major capsid protein [Thermanaeromonas toyohensis]SMB97959.1 phage major capsid protein, HK97 family [Thermanaeromonas toyohensis ToBE]